MRAIHAVLGLTICFVFAFSLSTSVQAQMCCVSLSNVMGDSSGISGQFTVTNVAIGTGISYSYVLQYTPGASLPWSVATTGGNFAGTVQNPGGGTFPFWCNLQGDNLGNGLYDCALTVSVNGGASFGTVVTQSFSNL